MASGSGRRMVFDIRGRRRHVVKVVYAVLALLMGASLFLVVGPVNLNGLLGGQSETGNAAGLLEEQAERIERKLRKDPEDPNLLLGLTRTRISAGNSLAVANPETGTALQTPESNQQLQKASEAWSKYLKAADEPSAGAAALAAPMLFSLAEYARTGGEAETNIRAAAGAQQIVAEQRPSLGSLSTLAIYRYYSFDFGGAKEARTKAGTYAHSKFEKENLGNELDAIAKRGHEFQKQLAEINKEARKAREKGEPAVANPLGEANPLAQPGG